MANSFFSSPAMYRCLYVALAIGLAFLHLLPMQTSPSNWVAPDILLCLTFAWALRRPDYVPALLVAAVMLVSDFIFLRPPGLQAALVVLGVEFLRSRMLLNRELPFVIEWVLVAAVFFGIAMINRLFLMVVLVDPPAIGLTVVQIVLSLLTYPVVVFVSVRSFNVRKIAPGDTAEFGQRL